MSKEELPTSNTASLETIQNTLDELLLWLKISGIEKAQNALKLALDTDEKKLVYHLSNGDTQDGIVEKSGVSAGTVSNYWNRWHKLGLMKKVRINKSQYRYIKNFDLSDFGIELSNAESKKKQKAKSDNLTQKDGGKENVS